VGNTIFKNKFLDDKIEETGYEFPWQNIAILIIVGPSTIMEI
jgi:hypothetical protein